MEMALDEAKERRRVRQAARAYNNAAEQWQREYEAKLGCRPSGRRSRGRSIS